MAERSRGRGRSLVALALLVACGGDPQPPPPPEGPLDLVLVLTDDQRVDTLGCGGSSVVPTPNIDRLAREGVFFESSLVSTSLCCPSRASILTGLYAHRTGVLNNFPDAPGGDPLAGHATFPELLQRAGYETAYFGKWHLPNPGAQPYRGFDRWASFEGQGEYFDQTLNVDGRSTPTRGYATDVLFDMAIAWLERPREAPRFTMIAVKNCHHPYRSPERHQGALAGATIELPDSLDDPDESYPAHIRAFRDSPFQRRSFEDLRALTETKRLYLQSVLSIDDNVGRLVEALESTGDLERTLLVFTSDNGLLWGEHRITHKIRTYELSIRVPLIVRFPGGAHAGERERRPVLNVDLAPTLLDQAGLPAPATMQGRSLFDLWREDAPPWRERTLHYESVGRRDPGGEPRELALRAARWKYLRLRGDRIEEALYDLEDDPEERRNRAGDPALAARLDAMRAALRDEMRSLDVPAHWFDPLPRQH